MYPAGLFAYHLKPFKAAIDAGVSSVMPYYGVPIALRYEGVAYEPVGMAFSKQIVTDLLRGRLGFKGYVNSDTGIITSRAWGLEGKTIPERVAAAINSGTDVLSGFHDTQTIIDLVRDGLLPEARVTEAAKRLLKEQFLLGLFENPYVDAAKAGAIVGRSDFRAKAMDAQRKSIVLLQNQDHRGRAGAAAAGADSRPAGQALHHGAQRRGGGRRGLRRLRGRQRRLRRGRRPAAPQRHGRGLRDRPGGSVEPAGGDRRLQQRRPATGANPAHVNPVTGKPWGADDPTGLDNTMMFGGAFPWEASHLSFTKMAESVSWEHLAVTGRHQGRDERGRREEARSSASTSASPTCSTMPAA